MNRGYVRLWRKSLDAGWIRNHKLWAFWSYCLLKASYKEYDVIVGLQIVHLLPGEFIFGRRKAAKETGLSEQEIRTIVAFLRRCGNLTIKTTNKFSIITIVNWSIYQGDEKENNHQINQPLTNKEPHTNIKEVKNKTFSSDSVEVRLSELLFEKILSINPTHKQVNLKTWAREIDRMIRIDHRSPEDIRRVIEWCQSDPFWQSNILSAAKLREKFDQLTVKIRTEKGKKAESVSLPVQEINCPRCKRELVIRNQLYGGGCIFCEPEIEYARH